MNNNMNNTEEQLKICKKFGAEFIETQDNLIVGVSLDVTKGVYPINGLRHPIVNNTSGWYIWSGEYSSNADFFIPLHAEHLKEWCPQIIKYLGLPPGWRFQFAPNYQDVWEHKNLLDV